MKRLLCTILTCIFFLSFFAFSAFAQNSSDSSQLPEEIILPDPQTEQNVFSAVSCVTQVSSFQQISTALQSGTSAFFCEVDVTLRVLDAATSTKISLQDLYDACKEVPLAVRITSRQAALNLLSWYQRKKPSNLIVISSDYMILRDLRSSMKDVTAMMDYTALTDENFSAVEFYSKTAQTANAANASGVLLNASVLNDELYHSFCSRFLSVWAILEGDAQIDTAVLSGADGIVVDDPNTLHECLASQVPNTVTRTPLLVAHRGVPEQAPENSLSGFQLAMEQGADLLEVDIHLTSDQQLVLMHDSSVDRTTTGSGKVNTMTLEQIKKLHLWGPDDRFSKSHAQERVPTLAELFELVSDRDVRLVLELKTAEDVIPILLCSLISEYQMEDRVNVICFNGALLQKIRELIPVLSAARLFSLSGETAQEIASDACQKALEHVAAADVTCEQLSREAVSLIRARGVYILSWTYAKLNNNLVLQDNALLWGVSAVTTNDTDYFKGLPRRLSVVNRSIQLKKKKSSISLEGNITFYGNKKTSVSQEDASYQIRFLSGDDVVQVRKGKVTALKNNGIARFCLTVNSTTPAGQPYILCSQPITVTVGNTQQTTSPQGMASSAHQTSLPSSSQQAVIFFSSTPFNAQSAMNAILSSNQQDRQHQLKRDLVFVIVALIVMLICFICVSVRIHRENLQLIRENRKRLP